MPLGYPKPVSRAQDKREASKRKLLLWQRVRREVLARDKGQCRVCGSRQRVDVHHVRFRSVGGSRYDTSNLAAVCRPCHQEIHAYRLVLHGNANDRLRVEWLR